MLINSLLRIPYSRCSNIYSLSSSKKNPPKKPELKQIKEEWNQFSQNYSKFDLAPQTFYYSFLSFMDLSNSKNVLEVACGNGGLLPLAISFKNNSTKYLGVDLAQNMIQRAKTTLRQNFQKYDSKLSFQEWMNKNNIKLETRNAQERVSSQQQKFDRIICNCVLMLIQNPQKMLESLYAQAAPGCIMGISVWGNKQNNNFMTAMRDSILESGFQLPNQRSNFHLYRKVSHLAQSKGWKTLLNWQQNSLFPILNYKDQKYTDFFMHQINKLPAQQRVHVKERLFEKVDKIFSQKKGLQFSCDLYLFKKQ